MSPLSLSKKGKAGLLLLLALLLFVFFGALFEGHRYDAIDLSLSNQPPSWHFLLGSDDLGRDLLTRLQQGTGISLFIGIAAAFIDLLIGVLWGGIAALSRPSIDTLMMRVADTLYALPYLLVVIMLMVLFDQGIFSMLLALTLTGWITMARIVRVQLLQLKTSDYVWAARALGASPSRILCRHLLPNALAPILTTLALTIPTAIFTEAFLSFLGLGIRAPIASLGSMASDGLPALEYYPWRALAPLFMLTLLMLSFNLIADGIEKKERRPSYE